MDRTEQRPSEANRIVLVVGVDFTDSSDYALTLAKDLTRIAGSDAEVHVAHVIGPPVIPDAVADVLPGLGIDSGAIRALQDRTGALCLRLAEGTGMRFVPHVRIGETAAELADLAREVRADLLVVGARTRKGLPRALHRTLGARLARRAPCSVLTARAKEMEPEVKIEPPCEDCVKVRRESSGAVQWCARHSQHHVHAHQYFEGGGSSEDSWSFRA